MSTEEDKFKHSNRLHQEENAIHKQQAIAIQHGIDKKLVEDEPHRFAKHHVMDENIPHKVNKELTAQEKKMYQDLDTPNDRHSNGILPTDV